MSDAPANIPEDAQAQQLLDAYLSDLQAGRKPNREQIISARPDLASLLQCLEQLQTLAPPEAKPRVDPNATRLSGPLAEMGRRVGKYEIEHELGRGGMGVVYLARDTELGRPVALKMILSGSLADPEHQRRFQNEVRSCARLDHEGIVRVFDTGEFNGLTYLAMQYIDGPSLAEVLRHQRPDRETAVRCIIQLARTVAYLHSQGIVHRDLKPGNVMIQASGARSQLSAISNQRSTVSGQQSAVRPEVDRKAATTDSRPMPADSSLKITDFGLAKLLDDTSGLTCSNVVIGTPSYMAPEQARGESAHVGPAADVYALGAMLYEMLTGQPPFVGETALEVLLQVMSNEPAPLRRFDRNLPRDLEYICLKCLEKSPENRFASAQELADALELHLKGDESASPGLTAWHVLRRWVLRVPGLAARIGILALVGVTLIVRATYTGKYNFIPAAVHDRIPPFLVQLGRLPFLLAALGAWIGLSALLQRGLRTSWGNRYVPYLWGSVEAFILTTLLLVTGSLSSPLDVGFPLLIAGAGLWLRERLVWFTAGCCIAGYSTATGAYFLTGAGEQFHRHVIFIVGLIVTAYVVSYQVRRFRMLSRFYEGRSME